ncbi:hypothetical protein A6A06_01715 [Streptomyces sp. CB02923]|uniref:hypothetical protein n=1 Tax=Streptomyces sp. CB02923 TaxID=1718985 RepID=UPI00093A37D7|nr:hypothetical protein [Streptomyces sp. CB02923]OKI09446.1 hypothetical protein A6A06_01715 [Streptomyces sp. CB02923]
MTTLQLAAGQGLSDLQQKFVVALVSAIIGAGATLLVHFLKARSEPRKRISWDSSTDPGFAAIDDPEIRDKLSITYGHVAVKNIFSIRYRISNTGNRVVKGQQIRFSFPEDTQVLEAYLSPTPEPELRVERTSAPSPRDVIYKIGHLERNQDVQFRFVTAGEAANRWEAVPSNEEGDVDVQKRGAAEKKEDRAHVKPFLISVFLFLAVPYTLSSSLIDVPISESLATITRVTFLAYSLFHLSPVARTVRDLLNKADVSPGQNTFNASAHDTGTLVLVGTGDINGGVVDFYRQPKPSHKKQGVSEEWAEE